LDGARQINIEGKGDCAFLNNGLRIGRERPGLVERFSIVGL
jgi:hypothetical protein